MPSIHSRDSSILTAKILALCGSGLLTGGMLSLSYFTVPALLLAPSALAQQQWSQIYNSGKKTMPLLSLLTCTSYLALSRLYSTLPPTLPLSLTPTPLFRQQPFLYALAAACTLSMVPFTLVFMRGNISGLERAGRMLMGDMRTSGKTPPAEECERMEIVGGKTTKRLVDEWGMLNLGRVALAGVGFVVGVWGSLVGSGVEVGDLVPR